VKRRVEEWVSWEVEKREIGIGLGQKRGIGQMEMEELSPQNDVLCPPMMLCITFIKKAYNYVTYALYTTYCLLQRLCGRAWRRNYRLMNNQFCDIIAIKCLAYNSTHSSVRLSRITMRRSLQSCDQFMCMIMSVAIWATCRPFEDIVSLMQSINIDELLLRAVAYVRYTRAGCNIMAFDHYVSFVFTE